MLESLISGAYYVGIILLAIYAGRNISSSPFKRDPKFWGAIIIGYAIAIFTLPFVLEVLGPAIQVLDPPPPVIEEAMPAPEAAY